MKVHDENSRIRIQDPDPDPLVRGMDPRIRIHPEMSWIRNTGANNGNFWFTFYVCRYSVPTVYQSHIEEVPSQFQSAMVHSQVQWICLISSSFSGRQLLSRTSSCDLPFSTPTLCLYMSDPYSLNGDSRFKNIY